MYIYKYRAESTQSLKYLSVEELNTHCASVTYGVWACWFIASFVICDCLLCGFLLRKYSQVGRRHHRQNLAAGTRAVEDSSTLLGHGFSWGQGRGRCTGGAEHNWGTLGHGEGQPGRSQSVRREEHRGSSRGSVTCLWHVAPVSKHTHAHLLLLSLQQILSYRYQTFRVRCCKEFLYLFSDCKWQCSLSKTQRDSDVLEHWGCTSSAYAGLQTHPPCSAAWWLQCFAQRIRMGMWSVKCF